VLDEFALRSRLGRDGNADAADFGALEAGFGGGGRGGGVRGDIVGIVVALSRSQELYDAQCGEKGRCHEYCSLPWLRSEVRCTASRSLAT
jgi:hypothetical protein